MKLKQLKLNMYVNALLEFSVNFFYAFINNHNNYEGKKININHCN